MKGKTFDEIKRPKVDAKHEYMFDFEPILEYFDRRRFEDLDKSISDKSKTVVCYHWVRGLCQKGDKCDYQHIYNPDALPKCFWYGKSGFCKNGDLCPYLHEEKDAGQPCTHFDNGYCRHGEKCRKSHVFKEPCVNYLAGFCPLGPDCPYGHPKFDPTFKI